jgi:RNA polymerase sigma-70 factor (ECF subfamily)
MDVLGTFTDFIRENRGAIVRAARREGLSPEDAVECAQEALAKHLQLLHRGDAPAAPAEWLPYVTTIAKNAARNRRRRHHVALPHSDLTEDAVAAGSDPHGATAEDLLAEAEEHIRLRACVERLCGTQRSVVTLRFLEERAGEDVAAELGISRGYVDVLLHRAKAQIRACMME